MEQKPINSHRDLIVWQKSMILAKTVFTATKKFPHSELYGMISQMRRCSTSIPANIAEGYARRSRKEYAQFISIAYGSGAELETHLLLVRDFEYVTAEEFDIIYKQLNEVLRMLNALLQKLKLSSP